MHRARSLSPLLGLFLAACGDVVVTPPGASRLGNVVRATGAIGTLSWETGADGFAVCDLDVDVTVTSPGEPATDHLRASGLRASGGCW